MPVPETDLPVSWGTWLAAAAPIGVLLALLVWRRWPTAAAAPAGLALTVAVALLLFQTPLRTLAVAAGKGIWDAIFILYVVWPALLLYNVGLAANAFDAMQQGIRRLIPDRLLAVLTFAWVIGSFVQSIAGFGTPLAVTPPLLLGLGVQPVYAVLLPLIARAWGNMFGTLGVTWFATLTVVDLPDPTATLLYTAGLLWVPELLGGLAVAWIYGRGWALKRAWPAIAVISLVHGGLQLALVPFLPAIGNFLASTAALGAVLLLSRWSRYRRYDLDEPGRIFTPEAQALQRAGPKEREVPAGPAQAEGQAEGPAEETDMPLPLAFAPYAVLALLALVALLIPPVNAALSQVQVGLPFPQSTTGYGVQREATDAYAAFAPLTHPGTLLLISALAGYLLYRWRGLYPRGVSLSGIFGRVTRSALPATLSITGLLLISKVMDHSGEITVLALGVAAVAPRLVFLALSNFIGILGAFITSSNTASNLLFAPLQATAARAVDLPVDLIIAAQSTGGATGNAVAPSEVLLGATVAGIPQRTGEILAPALRWTLLAGLLTAAATLGLYWLV